LLRCARILPTVAPVGAITVSFALIARAAQHLQVGVGEGELRMRAARMDVVDFDLSTVRRATAAALAAGVVVAQEVIWGKRPHSAERVKAGDWMKPICSALRTGGASSNSRAMSRKLRSIGTIAIAGF
jgi:hypothetical protein